MSVRRVVVVSQDMFVQSRVAQLAKVHSVDFTIGEDTLSGGGDNAIVVVDLDSSDYDPFKMGRELRQRSGGKVVLLGFYPHVKADLKTRALEAGYDHVVTNREFVKRLDELLAGKKRDTE